MPIVTVSPKYQVVIPREIRESLGLEPGQKVQAFENEGRVEFVPVRTTKSLRGFVRGLDTTVERDRDRAPAARNACRALGAVGALCGGAQLEVRVADAGRPLREAAACAIPFFYRPPIARLSSVNQFTVTTSGATAWSVFPTSRAIMNRPSGAISNGV